MSVFIGENSNGEKIVHITADEYDLDTVRDKITPTTLFHSSMKNIHIDSHYSFHLTKDDLKINDTYSDDRYMYYLSVEMSDEIKEKMQNGQQYFMVIRFFATLDDDDIDAIVNAMSDSDSKDISVYDLFRLEEDKDDHTIKFCSDPASYTRNVILMATSGNFYEVHTSFNRKMLQDSKCACEVNASSFCWFFGDNEDMTDNDVVDGRRKANLDYGNYLYIGNFDYKFATLSTFYTFFTKTFSADVMLDIFFFNTKTKPEPTVWFPDIDLSNSEIEISSDTFKIKNKTNDNAVEIANTTYLSKCDNNFSVKNYFDTVNENADEDIYGVAYGLAKGLINPQKDAYGLVFTTKDHNVRPFLYYNNSSKEFMFIDRTINAFNDKYCYSETDGINVYEIVGFYQNYSGFGSSANYELDLYNSKLQITSDGYKYFDGSKNKNCVTAKSTDIQTLTVASYETPDYDHKETVLNFGSTYWWYGTEDDEDLVDVGTKESIQLTNISNDDFGSFFILISLLDSDGNYLYGGLYDLELEKEVNTLVMENNKTLMATLTKNNDGTYNVNFRLKFKTVIFSRSDITKDDVFVNISGYELKFMLL